MMIKRILTSLPGIGAALLPNATCPACWPVYAGILSSLGLGFLMTGAYFYLFNDRSVFLSVYWNTPEYLAVQLSLQS